MNADWLERLIAALVGSRHPRDRREYIVRAPAGRVLGTTSAGISSFKGIPYAAPPVGRLRWRPPQPIRPWRRVRDARTFGAKCVQPRYLGTSDSAVVGREDCLTLNVWTPALPHPPLPVLLFLHGGAHVGGSSSDALDKEPVYDGQYLAEHGPAVLVTANYRLGSLGFIGHPALSRESGYGGSGNYGHMDQIAALEWIRDNIEAFGGDPTRVTLFGHSAGGHSVAVLLASPLAAGLFSRALIQSGSPRTYPLEFVEEIGERMAVALGCSGESEVLKRLRARPAADLLSAVPTTFEAGRGVIFGPNVDGFVLRAPILDTFRSGQHNHMPVLLGTTSDEHSTFIELMHPRLPRTSGSYRRMLAEMFGARTTRRVVRHYRPSRYASPTDALTAVLNDLVFTCPTRQMARALSETQSEPVWRYFYTYAASEGPYERFRAGHGLDVRLLFRGSSDRSDPPAAEQSLSDAMIHYWTRFAAIGDPNGANDPPWPRYEMRRDRCLELGREVRPRAGVRTAECDFWDQLGA